MIAVHPLVGNGSHLLKGTKEIAVEDFFPIGSIESFDIGVVSRLSGPNEVQDGVMSLRPSQ